MSEIEKLYENAGVRYIIGTKCKAKIGAGCKSRCPDCDYNTKPKEYPSFTAEKQLSLIKWLAFRDYIAIVAYRSGEYHSEHDRYNANENSLEDCLARLINNLWQSLTETEKAEIRRILE